MKLLLTSGGISNQSIIDALFELACKKPQETSIVFIPTASNVEFGDKSWFIDDLVNLKKCKFKSIEIADISAVEKEIWAPKLEQADILYFEGGNVYHLMKWIEKSGLSSFLPEMLQSKVYVGSSAGSMVVAKGLPLKICQIIYGENLEEKEDMPGLGLVDFYFLPHLNSSDFNNREENFLKENFSKEILDGIDGSVYALDDNSALKVVDGDIEVVSEGKCIKIK